MLIKVWIKDFTIYQIMSVKLNDQNTYVVHIFIKSLICIQQCVNVY